MKKPKPTIEQLANKQVVAILMAQAVESASYTGNGQIVQVVESLNALEELTSESVQQVIGFVDGNLELTKRMAIICKKQREEATQDGPYDNAEEVPASQALAFTGSPEQTYMIRTRTFLAAVWNHLEGKQPPSPLKELISVPDLDKDRRPDRDERRPDGYNRPG